MHARLRCGGLGGPRATAERLRCRRPASLWASLLTQVKDYLSALVGRRNTMTGVLYRDDPTIFRWAGKVMAGLIQGCTLSRQGTSGIARSCSVPL